MDETFLFPFDFDTDWLSRYSKLPLHTGVGKVDRHGDPSAARLVREMRHAMGETDLERAEQEFSASFFVPPAGNCLVFLRWPHEGRLSRDFGEGLSVMGHCVDGPFQLTCPVYYVKAASPMGERPGWAVASPTNQPATVTYGEPRAVAAVTATINNFDFDHGNLHKTGDRAAQEVLRVMAAGRTVDFEWRRERVQLRRLVDSRLMGTTSFVTFTFAAWPGASDEDLIGFAHNISSMCSYVAGQHTGIPVVSFIDAAGRIVRRSIGCAVQSKFRADCALRVLHAEYGLPRLFRRCFDEHCRMQQSEHWRGLPSLYAAIEDPPYLEQKYATLMMAVELFIRNSIIENGHFTQAQAELMTLPKLIGSARAKLGWVIPRHYTEAERYRKTRNAVDHGAQLPHHADQIRADFDKWKLFLLRRLFIRLGFDAPVASPQKGWASCSPVDEFSEEHNSFRI